MEIIGMKLLMIIMMVLILWFSFAYPQAIRYTDKDIETIHNECFDNRYKAPSREDSMAISAAIYNLLRGNLYLADYIIDTYLPEYELHVSKDYIMMAETGNNGWASFVMKFGRSNVEEDVVICAPHDRTDLNTANQAIEIFNNDPDVSYMLLNGSKRYHKDSDCSHDYNNPFHWMIVEIANLPRYTTIIELHGNARSNCGDYFITNSIRWKLSEEVMMIKEYLQSNNYLLGSCDLWGTMNINGQHINKSVEDQFIHIEQSYRVRSEYNNRLYLIEAIKLYLP
jgi:hypothetical protein